MALAETTLSVACAQGDTFITVASATSVAAGRLGRGDGGGVEGGKGEGRGEREGVNWRGGGGSIRMVEQYQIGTDQNPSRLDMLVGAAAVRPEFAYRVQG